MISLILISAAAGIAGISGMLCLLLPRRSVPAVPDLTGNPTELPA